MSGLIKSLAAPGAYVDRRYPGGATQFRRDLSVSSCLYVGNLSFYTTEEQIYELFSKAGEIKRIIMGLDKQRKTPCGFCFVEYYLRTDAQDCIKYINGTKLDDRQIRTDIDPGFKEGRQYGRGQSGGQVRDENRTDFDEGRGGWGHSVSRQRLEQEREREQQQNYEAPTAVPEGGEQFGAGPEHFTGGDEIDEMGRRKRNARDMDTDEDDRGKEARI